MFAASNIKMGKKHDNCIKGRLLKSACEAFAEKGYRDATVAEICEHAGANIAAVNYYFGSKETLYVEAWRLSFHQSLEKYPADGGVEANALAEQRLRGRIFSIIRRFTDPESYEFEIMHKELANPTGLLAEVMHKTIEPLRRGLGNIVRELLGEKATEQQVLLCQMSIRSQCFDLLIRGRRWRLGAGNGMNAEVFPEDVTVDGIADHITRFCLAGIRDMRQQIEKGELNESSGDIKSSSNQESVPVVALRPGGLNSTGREGISLDKGSVH